MANRKFIPELLQEINENIETIEKYKDNIALRMIFEYAFLPQKKFDLPEGEPPFKKDAAPIGMSPANFIQEIRRFYIFTKERQLQTVRRETLFIQLLESLHPSEAKLLITIKDQKLTDEYPNITPHVLVANGFLPGDYPLEQVKAPKPTRGRARKES